MHLTNWKTSQCNLPGKAFHIGESSVVLPRPVPEISEIKNTQTDTHTQNTAINIINQLPLRFFLLQGVCTNTITKKNNASMSAVCLGCSLPHSSNSKGDIIVPKSSVQYRTRPNFRGA